ncbi:MAG: hypothetical protein V4733_02400 [Verrucomicrobiota bacterium]
MQRGQTMDRSDTWPVFPFACCALGAMGLAQIWIAGMALADRFEQSRSLPAALSSQPMVIHVPAPAPVDHPAANPALPPLPPPPALPDPVRPTPLDTPAIADARADSLAKEARSARVAGDMGKAIVKLEEALAASPEDPQLLLELGLVHEQMGVFDIASSYYERVFRLGVTGAGALYQQAADKLRDGFETPDAMIGKLSLGRVRIFKDPDHAEGERVILTIPVQKAPGETIDGGQVAVSVHFFNRTNKGEIVPLDDSSRGWVRDKWIDEPVDWTNGGEDLRMVYTVPRQDLQSAHLFGKRAYYGQVAILQYGGQILDVQAWPRELAARINHPQPSAPAPAAEGLLPEFQDSLPPDFDPTVPLLPSKHAK